MKKQTPHIVSEHKVWVIEANRLDNNNLLYFKIWADNAHLAEQYFTRYLRSLEDMRGVEVKIASVHPVINGRYEDTLNCQLNHPEKYNDYPQP